MTTTLLQGDCRAILPTLPAGSVQCVVTSPPYFGLRDYGADGQIGLEPTPDAFVAALVAVFREVWRVLRGDGTVWLNLGDSYNASPPGNKNPMSKSGLNGAQTSASYRARLEETQQRQQEGRQLLRSLKPKDLIGIPWLVAFALRADGWYLRSDIIWAKPNPMPESVTDRPTKAHEYIFLLSKSERYYYDADAVRESAVKGDAGAGARNYRAGTNGNQRKYEGQTDEQRTARNRRTVWTVATQPYTGAHFATFPEKLIEPCILAGSAARACEVCGAPWARVVEKREIDAPRVSNPKYQGELGHGTSARINTPEYGHAYVSTRHDTGGFRPTCTCPNDGTARSVVLDPFVGSGTTCRVAERLGRDSIGIDLGYTDLQEKRTDGVQKVMVDLL